MHYYQFNIGDYIKHTFHLTPDEDLAYRRLLDIYYDTEQPLQKDFAVVARRIRMPVDVTERVVREFFEDSDDGWRNFRADQEIAKYHEFIEKQKANGSLGGRPKKTHGLPSANPEETQEEPKKSLNTNQEPITNNQEKEKDKKEKVVVPGEVDQKVWEDFLAIRKAKRAPLSSTALEGIKREAGKAGWTLNQALTECVVRGWQGFKAEWVNKPVGKPGKFDPVEFVNKGRDSNVIIDITPG